MKNAVKRVALASVAVSLMGGTASADVLEGVNCDPAATLPCAIEATGLPLRLLVKPQSNIYLEPDEGAQQIRSNVPAFEVLYAFEMVDASYNENFEATGWFSVGPSVHRSEGYMRATDVVPWIQALAVAFTNPGIEQRSRVIMFDSSASLNYALDDLSSGVEDPFDYVQQVMQSDPPQTPPPPGVVSREGTGWVDINQTFYLMPILSHTDLSAYDPAFDLRGLQLAALTNQARSEQTQACDIRDTDSENCFQDQAGGGVSNLALDAVFVIDMTASMQPFIAAVRDAVRESAQAFSSAVGSDRLKFGLVGYRDDPNASPGLDFLKRNFTPELLVPSEFSMLLTSSGGEAEGGGPAIAEAKVGSGDNEEEIFAGVEEAINSNWSADAGRVIILIGDAPSHPIGHEKNMTGLDEIAIREMADQAGIYVASIYVGSKQDADFKAARPQFETMAAGTESTVAFAIAEGGTGQALQRSLREVIDKVLTAVTSGSIGSVLVEGGDGAAGADDAILTAVRAAFVDYVGEDASAPSNIVAWALDRDPVNFEHRAFDVKVLIERREMEEMKALLEGLNDLLLTGGGSGTDVIDPLTGMALSSSYDLGIEASQKIGESPNVPRWIDAMPYRSEVLTLTEDEFLNLSADDRTRFEARLGKLVAFYNNSMERPAGWVQLNEQANVDEKVYMLDLSNLP